MGKRDLVRLDIGGLGIDLGFTSHELAGRLHLRYRSYKPSAEMRFRGDVEISSLQSATSLLNMPLEFDNGVLRCDAPGCQGFIDPFQRRAELQLSAAQPLEEMDYFLRMICALVAFEAGGLMFHAAGILRRGKAYVFYGHSGSGKTTIAHLSAGEQIISDDLLLIMPSPEGWQAHATPFWNQWHAQPPTVPEPLFGLFRLVKDQRVYLEPVSRAHAVAEMAGSAPVISADPDRSQALLQRCQSILDTVPAYRLHFLKDTSFWRVIDHAVQAEG